jgi:hypothetical protein
MKRKNFRNRVMAFPAPFARAIAGRQPNLARRSPANGQRPQMRKIFVIKKVSWLLATNAGGRKIQRVLIFDNHPDSLRLLSGYRGADSHFHISDRPRTTSWGVALLWILVVGVMMAMFWPLY